MIADAANPAVDVPALTTSLRGLANIVVEVSMLERAVHSGMFGGPAGDALTALCRLLATLHDDKGEVAVAGLTVGTSEVPDTDEDTFRGDAGLLDGVELLGTGTITERLAHKPAIAVLGIDAPAVDGSANILLPRARAMVSVRLAPGDESGRAVEAVTEHLRRHVPWGAHLDVSTRVTGEPFALEATGDVYDLAREALSAAFGHGTVEMGMGGTIPFIAEFARTFPGAAVLVTGVGDPASRWHGVDESLHLGMFGRCVLAEAMLLRSLAPGGSLRVSRRAQPAAVTAPVTGPSAIVRPPGPGARAVMVTSSPSARKVRRLPSGSVSGSLAAPAQLEQRPVLVGRRPTDRPAGEEVAGSRRRPVGREVGELLGGGPVRGPERRAGDHVPVEPDLEGEVQGGVPGVDEVGQQRRRRAGAGRRARARAPPTAPPTPRSTSRTTCRGTGPAARTPRPARRGRTSR